MEGQRRQISPKFHVMKRFANIFWKGTFIINGEGGFSDNPEKEISMSIGGLIFMENVRLSGLGEQLFASLERLAQGCYLWRRPKSWVVGDAVKGLSSTCQGSRDTKEWTGRTVPRAQRRFHQDDSIPKTHHKCLQTFWVVTPLEEGVQRAGLVHVDAV